MSNDHAEDLEDDSELAAMEDDLGGDATHLNYVEEEDLGAMWLSDEEVGWAKALKQHLEGEPDIAPLPDLDYVEFAMAAGGNIEKAVKQIRGLQFFRRMYHVQDTVEEGVHYIQKFFRDQPGVIIHIDVSATTGTAIVAENFGIFDPKKVMASEESWKTMVMMDYYLYKLQAPTIRSIREGVYYLVDGELSWDNFDINMEHRWNDEIISNLPIRVKSTMVYNTNTTGNVVFGLLKKIMPRKEWDVLKLGCTYEWNDSENRATLSSMFLQPSVEAAMERMVQKGRYWLTVRYENAQNFKL